jgi:hypothetical protein
VSHISSAWLAELYPLFVLGVGVGALFGARALQHLVGMLLDPGAPAGASAAPSGAGGAGGAGGVRVGSTLHIGDIPRGDDAFLVAFATGGRRALERTLLATAEADGWLTRDAAAGAPEVAADARPASPTLARFHEHLLRARSSAAARRGEGDWPSFAAQSTAELLEPGYRRTLEDAALMRSAPARIVVALIPIAAGGIFVALGALLAPHVTPWLVLVLASLGAIFIQLARKTSAQSAALRTYLRWLEERTASLRSDAATSGRRGELRWDEVALGHALTGTTRP